YAGEFVRPVRARPLARRSAVNLTQSTTPIISKQRITQSQPAAVPVPKLPRIDMGLPGVESPQWPAQLKVIRSRWLAIRRWSLRGVIALLVVTIGFGGLMFSQGYFNVKKVFKGGATTAAALTTNVNPQLLKGEGDGRINVLLLGRGGGDHDGPDLTDSMLIASIDPVNKTSTLLSLPRDMWVQVPGSGAMKINAAWETGKYKSLGRISSDNSNSIAVQAGFSTVDQVVESVVGIPIHYNVLVDFNAFKQAVDTVGGISFKAPEDLIDPTIAWENDNNRIIAKAGPQTMDGRHSLLYVRSRETTSDFARAERQRIVLLALKEKVKTLGTLTNPAKLSGLVSTFGNNVQTDLSISDASRLYSIFSGVDSNNIGSIGLAGSAGNSSISPSPSLVTTANLNGQSIVQPKLGLNQYVDIQSYVRNQLKDPYLAKENAKVMVLNGTTKPGFANVKATELKSYGYNVVAMANAPTSGYTQTTLIDLTAGRDKYTQRYLEQRLNVKATTTLPSTSILPNGAEFVIILGSDETTP
ncbi:LCP family protein, partial [Candidatus Saccharibacteria bacterium]|nr:LCP family protein [Candidatus Saccharibacteria bacterium]